MLFYQMCTITCFSVIVGGWVLRLVVAPSLKSLQITNSSECGDLTLNIQNPDNAVGWFWEAAKFLTLVLL